MISKNCVSLFWATVESTWQAPWKGSHSFSSYEGLILKENTTIFSTR